MATPISELMACGPASGALVRARQKINVPEPESDVTVTVRARSAKPSSHQSVLVPARHLRPLVIELLKDETVIGIQVDTGDLKGSLGVTK